MTTRSPTTVSGSSIEPASGYAASRFNATRHGVLSKLAVLPWEDANEYQSMLAALVSEHAPSGTIEMHLIEELAGVIWRKRRLKLAEAAAHRRGLSDAISSSPLVEKSAVAHLHTREDAEDVSIAVQSTDEDTTNEQSDLADDEEATQTALEILATQRNDAYEAALATIREDTRDWWTRQLAKDAHGAPGETYSQDAGGLRRFIEKEVFPWFEERRTDLADRQHVRAQALGESLNPDRLERLGRYEVHLDRKLERTLSTLIRLQELRRERTKAVDG